MNKTRISITLPPSVVREIDKAESNRSQFVLEAVSRELERRRRARLRESLDAPHPESRELAEEGLADWFTESGLSDVEDLLVLDGGRDVSWRPGRGWIGEEE